jgi:hypothetical protein
LADGSNITIDDVDVTVLSGPHKGAVHISVDVDKHLAGFNHLLHKRQLTIASVLVLTECVKIE